MKNKKFFFRLPLLLMGVMLVFANGCNEEDIETNDDGNTFTDQRDGKVYQIVTIGNQVWMAENLAYKPNSGNYWAYNNDNSNVEIYGYLYDWETAQNVCPSGWHLPSDGEWRELSSYLGGYQVAGAKLRATGTIEAGTGLWFESDIDATNETGFTALPGGAFGSNGNFTSLGYNGYWWSTSEYPDGRIWTRYIWYNLSNLAPAKSLKTSGNSVRCVRD